jgi:hypothetical protein
MAVLFFRQSYRQNKGIASVPLRMYNASMEKRDPIEEFAAARNEFVAAVGAELLSVARWVSRHRRWFYVAGSVGAVACAVCGSWIGAFVLATYPPTVYIVHLSVRDGGR